MAEGHVLLTTLVPTLGMDTDQDWALSQSELQTIKEDYKVLDLYT